MRTQPISLRVILLSIYMLGGVLISFSAAPFSPQEGSSGSESNSRSIISGGTIGTNEILCGSSLVNIILNESEPLSDGGGDIELCWESRLIGGSWATIPGANDLNYAPGFIEFSTEFRRGCREPSGDAWIYSNAIIKHIVPPIEDVKVYTLDVTCKYGSDGLGAAQVVGGRPEYTFEWSNGSTGGFVFDLSAGFHTITVTDLNGCTFTTDEFEVMEPEQLVTITEIENDSVSCAGLSDGFLYVDAIWGDPPYNFVWSNGEVSSANYDLPAGTYDVQVTDAKGCRNTLEDLTVKEPLSIDVEGITRGVSCFGVNDGEVSVEISGGTPPYIKVWNDGNTESVRHELSAGTYEIAVLDANECVFIEQIMITQPDSLLVIPHLVNNIICKASVNIIPSGGTAPFTYAWNTGESESFLTNLCPGDYSLTTTDFNGCEHIETLHISADYTIEVITIQVVVNPITPEGEIVIKLPYKVETQINVYNTAGQLIESQLNLLPSNNKEILLVLNLDKYSDGIYIINVEQNGVSASERVMLAR